MSQRAIELFQCCEPVIACADNRDLMRGLADGSMKLIVASQPYNIGKSYERRPSLDSYLEDQKQDMDESIRLLHPRGSICALT